MLDENHLHDIGELERIAASGPDSVQDIEILAEAYADVGHWDDAVRSYRAAIDLEPANPDLYNSLATIYEELGDVEKAEKAYQQAVLLQPNHSAAHFNLGSLFRDEKRISLAIQAFERCVACSADREERAAAEKELASLRHEDLIGATFGIRAVAYIIDTLALFGLQYIAGIAGGHLLRKLIEITGSRAVLEKESLEGWPFYIFGLVVSILYFVLLEGGFGASLGKVITGLRVVNVDGSACDFRAALIRALYRFVDGFFFGIPAAATMRSPLQQRHGDRAAKTVVIRSGDASETVRRPGWRFLVASGLHLAVVTVLLVMIVYIIGTRAAEALPDLSEVVLTPQDFHADLLEVSTDVLGLEVGQPMEGDSVIESVFALTCIEPFEMIWGFTWLLPTIADQSGFDREIDQKNVLLESLIEGLRTEGAEILDQGELSDLKVVGDASLGVTVGVSDAQGNAIRLDVVVFRRDTVAASVYVSYMDGAIPAVSVDDAARRLDGHIIVALPGKPRSLAATSRPALPTATPEPSAAPLTLEPGAVRIAPDGSGDYPDLKTAVNAADPGGIIVLEPGTYDLPEPLDIDKSLHLVGAGMDETEIVSEAEGHVVRFSADGLFAARDIAFRHHGDRVSNVVVVEDGEVEFVRCRFSGAVGDTARGEEPAAGLQLQGSTSGVVQDCVAVENDGDGIWVADQAQPTLEGNICKGNTYSGIAYTGTAAGVARENECSGNQLGIGLFDRAQPTLEGNVCKGNTNSGIVYTGTAAGVARGNECSGNQFGIGLVEQAQPTLEGNICKFNQYAGIGYEGYSGGLARENECSENDVGIEVSGIAQPTLEANICTDNNVGIKVLEGSAISIEGAAQPTLEGNICRNNEETGIKYLDGTGGVARGNECSGNKGPGIFVAEGAQPTLEGNTCTGNETSGIQYAVTWEGATGGVARQNECSGNGFAGIEVGDEAQPTLEENICTNNRLVGIGFYDNSAGVAERNECTDNGLGIFVADQAKPTLEGNVCANNERSGIVFTEEAGGAARRNECFGNLVGLDIAETANPDLEDNDCHDNTEADVKDHRP